ncbi:hypothetical protein SK128_007692 [Halocaridina rubra]|uniref:Uncharacterized protein n=1 Tax=Halocaridina rubra TaxID=373956 RepID=A0AAN8XD07_HALRR
MAASTEDSKCCGLKEKLLLLLGTTGFPFLALLVALSMDALAIVFHIIPMLIFFVILTVFFGYTVLYNIYHFCKGTLDEVYNSRDSNEEVMQPTTPEILSAEALRGKAIENDPPPAYSELNSFNYPPPPPAVEPGFDLSSPGPSVPPYPLPGPSSYSLSMSMEKGSSAADCSETSTNMTETHVPPYSFPGPNSSSMSSCLEKRVSTTVWPSDDAKSSSFVPGAPDENLVFQEPEQFSVNGELTKACDKNITKRSSTVPGATEEKYIIQVPGQSSMKSVSAICPNDTTKTSACLPELFDEKPTYQGSDQGFVTSSPAIGASYMPSAPPEMPSHEFKNKDPPLV